MDQEPEQQSKRQSPLVLILIIIIVLLAAAAAVLVVGKFGGQEQEPAPVSDGDGTPVIGYEEGVTAIDTDSLQKAVDEMNSKAAMGGIPVSFQTEAYSDDGVNFTCVLGSPANAKYDIFFDIFADAELTDELYLSGLISPGNAMEKVTLNHALPSGTTAAYVAVTQVEDDHNKIRQQTFITVNFIVK